MPKAVFFDQRGNPLSGGLVYTQVPGGGPPKTVWQDAAETIPQPYPIVLDADGACLLYGSGTYFIQTTDALGNQVAAFTGTTTDILSAARDALAGSLISVPNIAALRAVTSTTVSNSQVYVLGYYQASDNGEGAFVYIASDTTSADNGGTIIIDASNRRWYRETEGLPLNVLWFGARGDGSTDDSATFQATVTAAVAAHVGVRIPGVADSYRIGTTITVAGALDISGDGVNSNLFPISSTMTIFTVTTPLAVSFDGLMFGMGLLTTQLDGAAITFDPGAGQHNGGSIVTNCGFRFQHIGLNFVRAYNFFVENCQFFHGLIDMVVQDVTAPDSGDSTITGCIFAQTSAVNGVWQGTGIQQNSSGGLKVMGCKFLGHNFGYSFQSAYNGVANTSQLQIIGNNFDTVQLSAIVIQEGVAGEIFGSVFICDNLIVNSNVGIESGPILGGGGNWLRNSMITNNQISIIAGQGPGIFMQSGDVILLDGNTIISEGGTVIGIHTEAACTNVKIGSGNQYIQCTTNIVPSGSGVVDPVFQTGSVSVTPTTITGSSFISGGVAITFSPPFTVAPTVTCTPAGGSSIGARAESVTTTGATILGLAAVSGTPMTVQWVAQGY
jgi:hypothetical protein